MYRVIPVYINIANEEIYEQKGVFITMDDGSDYQSHIISKFKHAVKLIYQNNVSRFRMCFALNINLTYYYNNVIFTQSVNIPWGGVKVYGDEYDNINNKNLLL